MARSAANDLATVAKRYKGEFILAQVEFVDDAVIADAEAEFGTALQSFVRKSLQPASQVPEFRLDAVLHLAGEAEEDRVEFAGINLRGLVHRR